MKKRTKIVCTIGPASENEEVLGQLIEKGLNVCRLNFSHGTHEEQKRKIDLIKRVRQEKKQHVAILLDTKGPEIRTGLLSVPAVSLAVGQPYTLTTQEILGDESRCSVSYKELIHDVGVGNRILIDDGSLELVIDEIQGSDMICHAVNEGVLKAKKGVNVPNVKVRLPALTDQDKLDLLFGIENQVDFIAASFVRKASDILEIRSLLKEYGGENIHIIAKIENQEGVDNMDEIISVADGIMVARGDLGVEIPAEEVPIVQKMLIRKCNKLSKPVITATQMLDSMIRSPRPTRAEVTDVANAIYDGTDAIMLSGETAAGLYPVEAVGTMSRIARRTEDSIDYDAARNGRGKAKQNNITNAISHATCTIATDIRAKTIITATSSGHTARMVSGYRPAAAIVAASPSEQVMRQLSLVWGVQSVYVSETGSIDETLDGSVAAALENGFIAPGDVVVVTAGVPAGMKGATNLIKVHIVAEVLAKGKGVGTLNAFGPARILGKMGAPVEEGGILVASHLEPGDYPMMEKVAAIVLEEEGLTSYGAVAGISLNKPVVTGAKGILEKLSQGESISLDPVKGYVYRGRMEVL